MGQGQFGLAQIQLHRLRQVEQQLSRCKGIFTSQVVAKENAALIRKSLFCQLNCARQRN
jgi:hypothetical protein